MVSNVRSCRPAPALLMLRSCRGYAARPLLGRRGTLPRCLDIGERESPHEGRDKIIPLRQQRNRHRASGKKSVQGRAWRRGIADGAGTAPERCARRRTPWGLRRRSRGRSPKRASMNRAQVGPTVAACSQHHVGVCWRKWTLSEEGGRAGSAGVSRYQDLLRFFVRGSGLPLRSDRTLPAQASTLL